MKFSVGKKQDFGSMKFSVGIKTGFGSMKFSVGIKTGFWFNEILCWNKNRILVYSKYLLE